MGNNKKYLEIMREVRFRYWLSICLTYIPFFRIRGLLEKLGTEYGICHCVNYVNTTEYLNLLPYISKYNPGTDVYFLCPYWEYLTKSQNREHMVERVKIINKLINEFK